MESGIFASNVPGTTERLNTRCVGIAGCGGLGSNAAVALVRSGVGRLILLDNDRVEEANLNRQYYFTEDVGRAKVDALAAHLRGINPRVDLTLHRERLTADRVAGVFGGAHLLVEAFDLAENKHWLIESWAAAFPDRPVVVGNGLGGIGRTGELRVMRAGNIYFCGDGTTDSAVGLCAARVALVANMQANVALELLLEKGPGGEE